MDPKNVKVLANGQKANTDCKINHATASADCFTNGHASVPHQCIRDQSSVKCYSNETTKGGKNGFYCCSQRHILRNYQNFMKSGLPQRVIFYEDNGWKDFPSSVNSLVRENFQRKKAVITEVIYESQHLLLNFFNMVVVHLATAFQKPIAWIDEHDQMGHVNLIPRRFL